MVIDDEVALELVGGVAKLADLRSEQSYRRHHEGGNGLGGHVGHARGVGEIVHHGRRRLCLVGYHVPCATPPSVVGRGRGQAAADVTDVGPRVPCRGRTEHVGSLALEDARHELIAELGLGAGPNEVRRAQLDAGQSSGLVGREGVTPHLGANLGLEVGGRQRQVGCHGGGHLAVGVQIRQGHQGGPRRFAGTLKGPRDGWPVGRPAVVFGIGAVNHRGGSLGQSRDGLEVTRISRHASDARTVVTSVAREHGDSVAPLDESASSCAASGPGPDDEKTCHRSPNCEQCSQFDTDADENQEQCSHFLSPCHTGPVPMGSRAEHRRRQTELIVSTAQQLVAREGAGALSLREVARELNMASSAIYRYFATRDELLTILILNAYNDMGAAVENADARVSTASHRDRFLEVARSLREWAMTHPHDYALILGTPVSGYVAPADTIAAAGRVPAVVGRIISHSASRSTSPASVTEMVDVDTVTAVTGPLDGPRLIDALSAWSAIYGLISFELFGHFVGSVTNNEAFFDAAMESWADRIGLSG